MIPGNGIGQEVVGEAQRVLEEAGDIYGLDFDWRLYD